MTRFLVKAKQEGYAGKTLGIPFSDGQAIVDEHTVPKRLGRTPAQVIEAFAKDFPDYEVSKIGDAGTPSAFAVPELPASMRKSVSRAQVSILGNTQNRVKSDTPESEPKPKRKRAAKKQAATPSAILPSQNRGGAAPGGE